MLLEVFSLMYSSQGNFSWTRMEKKILHLWAMGKTQGEVILELGITQKEYERDKSRLLKKLNASTETAAVVVAMVSDLAFWEPGLTPISLGEIMSQLTNRELEILCTLSKPHLQDATLAAVAQEMNISEGTLKKHLQKIYRKLYSFGISNRASATCLGWRLSTFSRFIVRQ